MHGERARRAAFVTSTLTEVGSVCVANEKNDAIRDIDA
jgi:hypothetical protein